MRPPAPSHHHQRPSRPLRQNSWVTDEDPIQPAPPPNHNGAQQYNTLNGSAHLSSSTSPGTTPPASSLEVALVKQRLVNALGREGALLRLSAQLVPAVKLHIRRKRRALPSASAVTAKQIVSAIRRSDAPFFDNWSAADVTEIVKHASQRQYMFGETIVLPNEPAVSCGIVVVVSGDTMSSSPMLSSSTSGNGNNNSSSKRRSSAPHVLGVSAAVGEGFNSPTIVQAASPQVVVAVISFSAFRRAIWRHLARNESVKDAVRSMRLQTLCDQFYATPLGLGACSWLLSSLPDASLIKLSASGAIACSTLLTGSPISFENELMMVIRGQVRASTSDGGCMTLYPGSCLGEFSCIVPQYLGHVDELVEDRSITSLVVDAANGPCDVWTLSFRGLHAFLATECTEEARVQVLQTYIQARQEWLHRAVQHQQIQRNNSSDQQQQYQTVVSALRDVPCFAHCSDTLLGDLCANAVAKFVPRGSYVVLEGTPSNDLYVIVQGTVDEVAVDTSVVAPTTPQRATLSRRSVIGEYFLTPSSWNTSFIATSHVDVLVISSTSATATLEKHRALKQALDVSTQGVDLLRRRFSQVPVPSAPPNTVLGSLQNERIGSGDSLSATPPAGTRGRRPTSTKKSITSGIGSVSISPREVASQLWLAWSQDVQQQQLDENFLLHGSGSSMLLSPSSPNQLSRTVIAALGGRLQTLPTRERSSSQHDTAASAAGPVWSMVRTVSAPLNYYSETSLVRLLSTPARYKTSRMLLRRAPSQDDDHERDEASDSHREPHTPVPLPDESAIPYHHEDSVLSVASLRQTKNMQPLTEMEVLGVPSQLFGQQASVPFILTMDESGSTDEWHFPNEMTTVVQNPNLRPRPPSPTQLPATPQRPHTTGGSSNNLTSESAFLRSTIVGTISPRPPRVASPGRPLTTGSIA
ncbi:cyclic nucleotide-binding protein, putative, partial [Bodo saltans]